MPLQYFMEKLHLDEAELLQARGGRFAVRSIERGGSSWSRPIADRDLPTHDALSRA
jgi:hypothetical protein